MRPAGAARQFLESLGEESSHSSDEAFHMPGRPRKNGWRWRTTSCPEDPPLMNALPTYPKRREDMPFWEMRPPHLDRTVVAPRASPFPPPPALQSTASAFGLYSLLTSPSFSESIISRRTDRPFGSPFIPGRERFTSDARSPVPPSPLTPPIPRRTIYKAADPHFSMGDLSVVVDAHQVVHTTDVTVGKRDGYHTINEYIVIKEIGVGSFGKVKLVRHSVTSKLYAMKILEPFSGNAASMEKRVQAMRREVAVMKRLSHPHLVKLHEVLGDMKKGRLYMVMQYIAGGSIAKKVTDWTIEPIPEPQLRKQARQLLSALKYMQINGVVHRDIKPENILVDGSGNAYLADFGMSGICTEEGIAGVEGTPAFMAPEICRGESAVRGDLVDMWALGISLYQLMYGKLPFTAMTQVQLTNAILNEPLMFPDEELEASTSFSSPHSSPQFKEMIRGMLEKNPDERWNIRRAVDCAWFASCPYETPQVDSLFPIVRDPSDLSPMTDSRPPSFLEDSEIEGAISYVSVWGYDY